MNRNRKLRIGVKYCGGCNPSYDRVALVRQMENALAGEAAFVSFEEKDLDVMLVVCGCETACVDISLFKQVPIQVVSSVSDGDVFVAEFLREASTGITEKQTP